MESSMVMAYAQDTHVRDSYSNQAPPCRWVLQAELEWPVRLRLGWHATLDSTQRWDIG